MVVGDRGHVEAFHVVVALATVVVDDIVDGALVVALKDGNMYNFGLAFLSLALFSLPDKQFVLNTGDLVGAVTVKEDDVIDIGAGHDKFVLLQSGTDKSFFVVDIELLVGFSDLGGFDGVK